MTAPLDHTDLPTAIGGDEFAVARSQCIDAFADLELIVAYAATKLSVTKNRDSLGRRVAGLAKAKPCPALSKADAAKLPDWIATAEVLVNQRASLVHSKMQVGEFPEGPKAVFANVLDREAKLPAADFYSLSELEQLKKATLAAASELASLVKGLSKLVP